MRLQKVMDIIAGGGEPKGYRVCWEKAGDGFLRSDYCPESDEPLIPTEDEAWDFARKLAAKTHGVFVNVYVVDDRFRPVPGYEGRKIINR